MFETYRMLGEQRLAETRVCLPQHGRHTANHGSRLYDPPPTSCDAHNSTHGSWSVTIQPKGEPGWNVSTTIPATIPFVAHSWPKRRLEDWLNHAERRRPRGDKYLQMRPLEGIRRRGSLCPNRPVTPEVAGSSPVATVEPAVTRIGVEDASPHRRPSPHLARMTLEEVRRGEPQSDPPRFLDTQPPPRAQVRDGHTPLSGARDARPAHCPLASKRGFYSQRVPSPPPSRRSSWPSCSSRASGGRSTCTSSTISTRACWSTPE
jgi:hypothetical protein